VKRIETDPLTHLTMSTEKTQRLVQSIIEFLEGTISDGSVKSDDKEGLEVAGKEEALFLSTLGIQQGSF
jgi:Homodimerisation domain of SGTA